MCPQPDFQFEQQLVAHRSYLLKFARLQLRNEAWAEDAVSETILAALGKPQAFGNRSQLKTWLIGLSDRARVRLHLLACKTCPNFERQLLTMRNAMAQWRNYCDGETIDDEEERPDSA